MSVERSRFFFFPQINLRSELITHTRYDMTISRVRASSSYRLFIRFSTSCDGGAAVSLRTTRSLVSSGEKKGPRRVYKINVYILFYGFFFFFFDEIHTHIRVSSKRIKYKR